MIVVVHIQGGKGLLAPSTVRVEDRAELVREDSAVAANWVMLDKVSGARVDLTRSWVRGFVGSWALGLIG